MKDLDGNEIGSFILSGADKDFFMIENGNLQFKNPAEFETQSTYYLNTIAVDELGNLEIKSLTITIHDGKTNLCYFILNFFLRIFFMYFVLILLFRKSFP